MILAISVSKFFLINHLNMNELFANELTERSRLIVNIYSFTNSKKDITPFFI